jgi:hypothetical protein
MPAITAFITPTYTSSSPKSVSNPIVGIWVFMHVSSRFDRWLR